ADLVHLKLQTIGEGGDLADQSARVVAARAGIAAGCEQTARRLGEVIEANGAGHVLGEAAAQQFLFTKGDHDRGPLAMANRGSRPASPPGPLSIDNRWGTRQLGGEAAAKA